MRRTGILCLLIASGVWIPADGETMTHETAPRLSDSDVALLHKALELAGTNPIDEDEGRLVAYALILQQYHRVPAYRELYRETLTRLLERFGDEPDLRRLFAMLYRTTQDSEESAEAILADDTSIVSNLVSRGWSTPDTSLSHLRDRPWGLAEFNHPVVARVEFPEVLVRQAVWDFESNTLLFILEPAEGHEGETTFHLANVPTNYVAVFEKDGAQIAAIDEHAQASGKRIRNLAPGTIEVTTTLEGPTKFAIRLL